MGYSVVCAGFQSSFVAEDPEPQTRRFGRRGDEHRFLECRRRWFVPLAIRAAPRAWFVASQSSC